MANVQCPECGHSYEIQQAACPNCGAPNESAQRAMNSEVQTEQPVYAPQPLYSATAREKTDWAHYVYECGALYWKNTTKNFANFRDRATRKEFWSFGIISYFVIFILYTLLGTLCMLNCFIGYCLCLYDNGIVELINLFILVFGGLGAIVVVYLPLLALSVRRMHDIGYNGWWVLCPMASWFLWFKRSDEGENLYGAPSLELGGVKTKNM